MKRKAGAGAEVWQVYGLGGELLAEYPANSSPSTPSKEYGYRSGELLVTAEAPSTPRANVALSSAGAAVTASSSYSASFPAASLINGDRKGAGWGAGGGWNDATPSTFPDAVEVTFSGPKTIDEVSVFTLQDNFASPVEPTESLTFAQYGVTSFTVQAWVGGGWVTVHGGSVSANDKVWRRVSFPPVTTTKIRVSVTGSTDGASRLVEVAAWESPRANHALGAGGATAAASSTAGAGFPASSAIDGDRKGLNWGAGGGWNDATEGVFTDDWLEVSFPSAKAVDEVNVFTLQDSFSSPSEPTEALTFSLYGLTSFEVQYWNGSSWQTVQGGSVSANNKVWRRVTFPAVETSKVRVRALGAADGYSRITELEAWGPTTAGGGAQVRWLVSDHLGTPRMVVDETGSLAGVSRHDYFPFGEELTAGVGGRTTGQGYSQPDGVRQKFTGYERDDETGLDFAQARYFGSSFGRFTSPDPIIMTKGRLVDPQAINLYVYARNNPLRYVDPNGEEFKGTDGKKVDVEEVDGQLVVTSNNASKELIRLIGLINNSGSDTALNQFNRLNAHKTMINLIFDTKDLSRLDRTGLHRPHGENGPLEFKDGKFQGEAIIVKDSNGNEVYAEATITLYEGVLNYHNKDNVQATEDGLVATFGHEAEHDLDLKQVQETKNRTYNPMVYHPINPDSTPVKGSPYWMTNQITKEIQEHRSRPKCSRGHMCF